MSQWLFGGDSLCAGAGSGSAGGGGVYTPEGAGDGMWVRGGFNHRQRGQCHRYQPGYRRGFARRLDSHAGGGVVECSPSDDGRGAGCGRDGGRGVADSGRCAHPQAPCALNRVLRLGFRSCAEAKRLWATAGFCAMVQWMADSSPPQQASVIC